VVNNQHKAVLEINCMCNILLDFNSKIISCDLTISVIRLFSIVGCFVLFCRPVSIAVARGQRGHAPHIFGKYNHFVL